MEQRPSRQLQSSLALFQKFSDTKRHDVTKCPILSAYAICPSTGSRVLYPQLHFLSRAGSYSVDRVGQNEIGEPSEAEGLGRPLPKTVPLFLLGVWLPCHSRPTPTDNSQDQLRPASRTVSIRSESHNFNDPGGRHAGVAGRFVPQGKQPRVAIVGMRC